MSSYNQSLTVGALLLLVSFNCNADGNKLLEQCGAAERYLDTKEVRGEFDIGFCLGMVQGVRNTMQIMGEGSSTKVCFPESGINNGQSTRIVTSFLRKNPSLLHENEVLLTMLAYADAYPCK